jgi:hypothetical protein
MRQPGIGGERQDPRRTGLRPWQRKRPLLICAVASFAVGLPLVSLSDGAVLSALGLVFELLAIVSVVLLVFAVIDQAPESDEEQRQ